MDYYLNLVEIPKINFSIVTIVGGLFFVLLGVLYYLIYHKHHKRNHVELFELIELVSRFYVRTIALVLFLALSVYLIIMAVYLQEERNDVIACIIMAIAIASFSIISYRSYIIKSLLDYNMEVREVINKKKLKIGEVVELICIIICILAPIWGIPSFIEIFDDKARLTIAVFRCFFISIGGLVVLFLLNPMNINKLLGEEEVKKKKTKKKSNNKDSKKTSKTSTKKTTDKKNRKNTDKN